MEIELKLISFILPPILEIIIVGIKTFLDWVLDVKMLEYRKRVCANLLQSSTYPGENHS